MGPSLQPPVANKMIFGDGFLKVMVVGGPNDRRDYHLQSGEEFFWQLKGHLNLHVVLNNRFRTICIPEGHCFLLPPRVPHSPRRSAGSVGIVVERGHEHHAGEMDCLRWYAREEVEGAEATAPMASGIEREAGKEEKEEGEDGGGVLYEEFFKCYDLGQELGPVIGRFHEFTGGKGPRRLWDRAGDGDPPIAPDDAAEVLAVVPFEPWIDECIAKGGGGGGGEGDGRPPFGLRTGEEKAVSLLVGGGLAVPTAAPRAGEGGLGRAAAETSSTNTGAGTDISSVVASFPTEEALLWQVRGRGVVVTRKRRIVLEHMDMALIMPDEQPAHVVEALADGDDDQASAQQAATLVVQNLK